MDAFEFTIPDGPGRVTYAMPETEDQLVVSFDPPQLSVLAPGPSGGHFIDTGEEGGVVACPGEGEEAQCFRVPEAQLGPGGVLNAAGGLAPLFGLAQSLSTEGELPGVSDTSEQEIAGRSAICATVTPDLMPGGAQEGAQDLEICADTETGIALRFASADVEGNEQVIEATAFEDPLPEDFEPPAEVEEMPAGPEQSPPPS